MAKGASFEREICKRLSLWWSGGKDETLFWRTHSSGARATQRQKSGKRTRGQYGDICATQPAGMKLTDLITFSLKRGSSKHTLQDLVDFPKRSPAINHWEDWISEVRECWKQSGSVTWAIIQKRDRREPMIVYPQTFRNLQNHVPLIGAVFVEDEPIYAMLLEDFLRCVKPEDLKKIK